MHLGKSKTDPGWEMGEVSEGSPVLSMQEGSSLAQDLLLQCEPSKAAALSTGHRGGTEVAQQVTEPSSPRKV